VIPEIGAASRSVQASAGNRHPVDAEGGEIFAGDLIIHPAVVLYIGVGRRVQRAKVLHIRHAIEAVPDAIRCACPADRGVKLVEAGRERRSQVEAAGCVVALRGS